jgi:hypothetical protein
MSLKRIHSIPITLLATVFLGWGLFHWHEKRNANVAMVKSGTVFTTTVDWYKPPPDTMKMDGGVEIPRQLIAPIREPLRQEATVQLGDDDTIRLTKEQATRFSPAADPNAVLQLITQERMQKLHFYRDHPVNEADVLNRHGADEVENQKSQHKHTMDRLSAEIAQLSQWQDQLKPYLIKAVVLKAGGSFSGAFFSDDLLITYQAMGSAPAPMERRPVVAFLPKKPRMVYTEVSMIE